MLINSGQVIFVLIKYFEVIFKARINRISEICMDIGQVCLASIVIPFLLNKSDIIKVFLGLAFSFSFWTISVLLVKTKK